MVEDLRVQGWSMIDSAVGDGGVSGSHLIVIYTVCNSSKRKGLVIQITENTGLSRFAFNKRADSEFFTVFKSQLLCDLVA